MNWHHIRQRFDPTAFHNNAEPEVKWIVEHLRGNERLVLDVGCLDSGLLSLLLPAFPLMVGIDIRRGAEMGTMTKRMDIRKPEFTGDTKFDAIIFLSTLEHIGLDCYGNRWFSLQGDGQALSMSRWLLSKDGRILVTAPFNAEAKGRCLGEVLWERRYNHATAMDLVYNSGLTVVEYLEDRKNEIICMELKGSK
ncbi:MAG: hypothetical protein KKD77_23530 [Gammaproteobacteria bacterium]|nr:hypothetical protein [Gammaproteobacteria bacterium]